MKSEINTTRFRVKISASIRADYYTRKVFSFAAMDSQHAITKNLCITLEQAREMFTDAEDQGDNSQNSDSLRISYKACAINLRRVILKYSLSAKSDVVDTRIILDNKSRAAGEKESDYD